jgi:putative ABC transport system permease protein
MGLWNDFRYALRLMRKSPGFTVLAVLVAGLGVGATSSVFGVVKAVLIDPLPFPDPDRLVVVHSLDVSRRSEGVLSFPDFRDLRDRARSVEEMAAYGEESLILGGDDGSERAPGELVTPAYFSLLGIEPVLGRGLTPEETYPPISEGVAVLSYDLFQRRFGGDPSVVGSRVRIDDAPFTVVGVLPPSFHGISGHAELWVPMAAFDALHPELVRYDILENRGTRWHSAVARLAPGVSLADAEGELQGLASALESEYPDSNENRSVALRAAYDEIVGDTEPSILLLVAAVALLLLLTCANLANLFLGRVLSRDGEVSVRVALGATRGRLARQLVTEAVVFGLAGGVVGALLSRWALAVLVALAPVELPGYIVATFDLKIFAFALLVSTLASVVFGLVPALATRGIGLQATARSGFGRQRAQAWLVLAEIALSTLLLVGAGLVGKSFYRMQRFEPGFVPERLLTLHFYLPTATTPSERLDRLVERVRSVPGVIAASIASHVYFGDGYMSGSLTVEGKERRSEADEIRTYRQYVLPGYFRTMGIPVVAGRDLDERDGADSPGVVVVNDSFAKRIWPGESPLGKRVAFGEGGKDAPWLTVVGVVGDVAARLRLDASESLPQAYFSVHQGGEWSRGLLVRSETDSSSIAPALLHAVRELDPGIALFSIAPMDELIARSRATARYLSYLLAAFSVLSLLLAAVGLYGVVSFAVSRSSHEMGVRLALGAERRSLVALVMARSLLMAAGGLGVGLGAALSVARTLSSLLYRVEPLDPATYLVVVVLMSAVAAAASFVPALRAASLDPLTALRRDR